MLYREEQTTNFILVMSYSFGAKEIEPLTSFKKEIKQEEQISAPADYVDVIYKVSFV